MFKKIIALCILLIMILGLSACNTKKDNTEWTDYTGIYATVNSEYADKVLKNPKSAFKIKGIDKIYVAEKYEASCDISLKLLLVVNYKYAGNRDEIIENLRLDYRIENAWVCSDVPYETIDTRCLSVTTKTISVGETLNIVEHGFARRYYRQFDFDRLSITLSNYDAAKTYTPADFPQVKLASVEKYELDGHLYLDLKLTEPGYFNIIKAANSLSKNPAIQTIEFYPYNDTSLVATGWQISDYTIADFVNTDTDNLKNTNVQSAAITNYDSVYSAIPTYTSTLYSRPAYAYISLPKTTIIGLSPGIVTVSYNDVCLEITVV